MSHAPSRIDTTVAHPARVYDHFLGGTTNFPADHAAAAALEQLNPTTAVGVRAARDFTVRAARAVAGAGVRQFLDLGSGIPTSPNLHEVAQQVDPRVRVVYVDSDPIVAAHAAPLLRSTPEGATAYVEADVTAGAALYELPEIRAVLDLGEPVALGLNALLHFFVDDSAAYDLVGALLAPLPSGSHVTVSHLTADHDPEAVARIVAGYSRTVTPVRPRDHAEVLRFLDGLELLEPGLVAGSLWRPDPEAGPPTPPALMHTWSAVARLP